MSPERKRTPERWLRPVQVAAARSCGAHMNSQTPWLLEPRRGPAAGASDACPRWRGVGRRRSGAPAATPRPEELAPSPGGRSSRRRTARLGELRPRVHREARSVWGGPTGAAVTAQTSAPQPARQMAAPSPWSPQRPCRGAGSDRAVLAHRAAEGPSLGSQRGQEVGTPGRGRCPRPTSAGAQETGGGHARPLRLLLSGSGPGTQRPLLESAGSPSFPVRGPAQQLLRRRHLLRPQAARPPRQPSPRCLLVS